MGRPRVSGVRPKVKIGISLDADLYEWVAERTGPGREFASISHGIERSIATYQTASDPTAVPYRGPAEYRAQQEHRAQQERRAVDDHATRRQ